MAKRRIKIINKKFQLKTTFSVLGITLIAFLTIIALLGISAVKNNRHLSKTVKELNNAIEVEDNITGAFLDPKIIKSSQYSLDSKKIISDHNKSMTVMRNYISTLENYVKQNFQLISISLGIVILFALVLYFYMIRITHRIAGPVYVLTRHMQDIIEGKEPAIRDLRDKDEFTELYETFRTMVNIIDKRKI